MNAHTFASMAFLLRNKTPLLIVLIGCTMLLQSDYLKNGNIIRGDALGYSAYLTSWVVHHDFTFDFYEGLNEEDKKRYWLNSYEGSKPIPKLTMGVAYAQLPLFVIAHWVSSPLGYASDGWSAPYQVSTALSGLIFFLFGLIALRRWLARRYSAFISDSVIWILFLATSVLHYATLENTVSHIYSFSLFAMALNQFDLWLRDKRVTRIGVSALLYGWIVLIRPTNGVLMLVPLIQLLHNREWKHFASWKLCTVLLFGFIPLIPQLVLWYEASGQLLFYSYGEEQIFWTNSQVFQGLFSYRNGWLLYTPIMILALIGLWFTSKIDRAITIASLVVIPIHVYIVFAWWCWYYGDSLSIRPMVDIYPLLAFGLAGGIRWMLARSAISTLLTSAFIIACMVYNVLLVRQYNHAQLSGSGMSQSAFWTLFFNSNPPSNMALTGQFVRPDIERLMVGHAERFKRDTLIEQSFRAEELGMTKVRTLSSNRIYGPVLEVDAAKLNTTFDRVLRISSQVFLPNTSKPELTLVLSFEDSTTSYTYLNLEVDRLRISRDKWETVNAYVRKPDGLPIGTVFKAFYWLKNEKGEARYRELQIDQIDCPYIEPN